MKRVVMFIVVIVVILSMYTCVGSAAGPETDTATGDETPGTMTVTVEDITAVTEQLTELDGELDMLAKLVYAEARGVGSKAEQAAVIWCALNRVDAGCWGDTISEVVRKRSQFAYASGLPVKDEFKSLAKDVVMRWLLEARGVENVGRTLPGDYLYFAGRGGHNWFRKGYRSNEYWDWSLPDPYVKTAA